MEVIELAKACDKLECLVLHSTAQVAGNRRGRGARGGAREQGRASARWWRRPRRAPRSWRGRRRQSVPIVGGEAVDHRGRFAHGRGRSLRRAVPARAARRHVASGAGASAARTRRRAAQPRAHRLGGARVGGPRPRDPRPSARRSTSSIPIPLTRAASSSSSRARADAAARVAPSPPTSPRPCCARPGLDRIAKSPRAFLETLTTPGVLRRAQHVRAAARPGRRPVPAVRVVRRQARRVRAGARPPAPRQPSRREMEVAGSAGVEQLRGSRPRCPARRRRHGRAPHRALAPATSCSSRAWSRRARGWPPVFAERGGDLTVAAPAGRAAGSSTQVVDALCAELGGVKVAGE